MDIRIASETARFGFVFSRRGIVPEGCSSWFLPRIVGISQALEWCYSGRVFDAQEALNGRLVKEVVSPEELLPRAYELAAEIRDNTSPVSVALTRQMMWRLSALDHPMAAHESIAGASIRARFGRCQGGRRRLPRKAAGEVPGQGVRGHALFFSMVGRAEIFVTAFRGDVPRTFRDIKAAVDGKGPTSRFRPPLRSRSLAEQRAEQPRHPPALRRRQGSFSRTGAKAAHNQVTQHR